MSKKDHKNAIEVVENEFCADDYKACMDSICEVIAQVIYQAYMRDKDVNNCPKRG